MRSPSKREDLEAKYDVVLDFPNLELHSAAASGNVGLVHYALTHGQPVNSVLHGVLPLHAACSGGSLSVVRMLIEQGADVNAPRLPRRYSDGKKGTAPSVGTAGSTPLHFAAANGHAPIVQMLLACGADPSKPDKNGHTPEDLARLSSHENVVHVLHTFQRLQTLDAESRSSKSGVTEPLSPRESHTNLEQAEQASAGVGSRKGKERAFSLSSIKSDGNSAVRVKRSIGGLWKRGSKTSMTSATEQSHSHNHRAPQPPRLCLPGEFSTPLDKLSSPFEIDTPTSPSPQKGDHNPFCNSAPPSSNGSNGSPKSLNRQLSNDSQSNLSSIVLHSPSPRTPSTSRSRHNSLSSHRPSLPSIIEKAAHPGQTFRAAMKGHQGKDDRLHTASSGGSKSRSRSSHGDLKKSAKQQAHHHAHGLKNFFRLGTNRERSPSPPAKNEIAKPIAGEELDLGIERLKRASLDLERRDTLTLDDRSQGSTSAPPTKSKFFEEESSTFNSSLTSSSNSSPQLSAALQPPRLPPRRNSPPASVTPIINVAASLRPRTGSEVIAPSPLANEWDENDSDGQRDASKGIRRVRTEVIRQHLSSSRPNSPIENHSPISPGKPRAYTLPGLSTAISNGKSSVNGIGRTDDLDLRKMAAEGSIRECEKKKDQEERGGEADDEERDGEEWHDALTTGGDEERALQGGHDEISRLTASDKGDILSASLHSRASKSGRIRSGSIGSVTTDASRISSSPSAFRISSITDDPDPFRRPKPSPLPQPPLRADSRARGFSLSSNSSGASGAAHSNLQTVSTPSTSLTLPSALSVTQPVPGVGVSGVSGGFPPVPEHEAVSHPSIQRRLTSRTILSQAEAQEAMKQSENEILQLAQLPPSLDSSRDLAAVLAAYGESHEMAKKFAEEERKEQEHQDETFNVNTTVEGDQESFHTANSGRTRTSKISSDSKRATSPDKGNLGKQLPSSLTPLIGVDVPRNNSHLSSIYDKRAAAYRERMAALTSAPLPSLASVSHQRPPSISRASRQRASSAHETWLDVGPTSRLRSASGNLPMGHSTHGGGYQDRNNPTSAATSEIGDGDAEGEEREERYPHISGPVPVMSNVQPEQRTRRGSNATSSSHKAHNYILPPSIHSQPSRKGLSAGTRKSTPAANSGGTAIGLGPLAPTPYASLFSHRFSGQPLNDDESDDEEQENGDFTVIENDWRGGRVISLDELGTGTEKKKWNGLKKLGRHHK
ncbi:hypothetical protein C349_03084 [Cryptococcus neoformans var. grubii Br795]|nr:hypothetical protein C353_03057 [Cryptococcus neoformans var. grubii AD1-83a]OXG60469.1 hypothetical protein C354_02994 [Cryptococcus neoformans var. grubii MW-RSA1955]OXG64268.1 hypothetical protein C351_02779 [Cryptococcus neoformans var. grubii c8]OXG65447.1 hypothetical protein C352_03004 [Cryptococcus neoformans var. grubii CHC193]OXG83240.1 hypothetical protein C349_03084 [Cryptococcus neoformans var. grubii Br795]OXG88167.1 hypothetical protein C346_03009 [Cryptococcus neoformans var